MPVVIYYAYLDPMYSGGVGYIWTPESSLRVLQQKNVDYETSLEHIALIEKEASSLNKDYSSISEEDKKKVFALLPDNIDPLKLRNELVFIANKAGIDIATPRVEVDTRNQHPALGSYIVTFSFRAHYENIKVFIEIYEKNLRLFIPDSFAISRIEKKTEVTEANYDPELLSVIISSRVYYLKK